jgi:SAM-dependent methyltransferase
MVDRCANFGCGETIMEGYENYDLFPIDDRVMKLDLDVLPLPFKDGAFKKIVVEHTFEHLNVNRHYFMMELCRILRPNGLLRISVPLYLDNVMHTKPYHPVGYFNIYSKCASSNSVYRSKHFEEVSVKTKPSNSFTRLAMRFPILEKMFPRLLAGERVFLLRKI